jgi:hypothetical protein
MPKRADEALVVVVLDDHGLVVVVVPPMMMRMADDDHRIRVGRRNGEAEHGQRDKRQNKLTHWAFSLRGVSSLSDNSRREKPFRIKTLNGYSDFGTAPRFDWLPFRTATKATTNPEMLIEP